MNPVPPSGPSDEDLDVDARLVGALTRAGCQGPLWDDTVRRLAAYGIGALNKIILEGRLERESAARGRRIRLAPEELAKLRADDHQRDELVGEAVLKGIDLFRRHTVLGGGWSRKGGARLHTYFVNGCVLSLANPVRAWLRTHRHGLSLATYAPEVLDAIREDRDPAADPADELLDREDTAAVLDALGPVLAHAALLRLHTGWPWARIAPAVGLSEKALERRLRRFRDSHDPRAFGANHD